MRPSPNIMKKEGSGAMPTKMHTTYRKSMMQTRPPAHIPRQTQRALLHTGASKEGRETPAYIFLHWCQPKKSPASARLPLRISIRSRALHLPGRMCQGRWSRGGMLPAGADPLPISLYDIGGFYRPNGCSSCCRQTAGAALSFFVPVARLCGPCSTHEHDRRIPCGAP